MVFKKKKRKKKTTPEIWLILNQLPDFLNPYHVPGSVLGAEDIKTYKTGSLPSGNVDII